MSDGRLSGSHKSDLQRARHCTGRFVGRIERGKANITLRNILRLADALDMDAGDLVRGLHADDE